MRTRFAIVLVLLLAGCSYRPLYGENNRTDIGRDLQSLRVEPQSTRAGQLIRSELMASRDQGDQARYSLALAVDERSTYISRLPGKVTERYRLRLSANYVLKDRTTGRNVARGSSQSAVHYDTVREPIADLQAKNTAVERAAIELAQDIKLRLAAALAQ